MAVLSTHWVQSDPLLAALNYSLTRVVLGVFWVSLIKRCTCAGNERAGPWCCVMLPGPASSSRSQQTPLCGTNPTRILLAASKSHCQSVPVRKVEGSMTDVIESRGEVWSTGLGEPRPTLSSHRVGIATLELQVRSLSNSSKQKTDNRCVCCGQLQGYSMASECVPGPLMLLGCGLSGLEGPPEVSRSVKLRMPYRDNGSEH